MAHYIGRRAAGTDSFDGYMAEVVYIESTLVKNKKAKGQKKTKSIEKNLESETVGVAQPYVSLIKI